MLATNQQGMTLECWGHHGDSTGHCRSGGMLGNASTGCWEACCHGILEGFDEAVSITNLKEVASILPWLGAGTELGIFQGLDYNVMGTTYAEDLGGRHRCRPERASHQQSGP